MNLIEIAKHILPKSIGDIIRITDDGIKINIPSTMISDNRNQMEIVEKSVVTSMLNEQSKYYMNLLEEFESSIGGEVLNRGEQIIKLISMQIQMKKDYEDKLLKRDEQYMRAIEENVKFNLYYGKAESPYSILNQLYRLKKGELEELVNQKNWTKYAYSDGAKYWLEMFEYWKIIKIETNYRYFSLMSWNQAKRKVFIATASHEDAMEVMIKKEYKKDNFKGKSNE